MSQKNIDLQNAQPAPYLISLKYHVPRFLDKISKILKFGKFTWIVKVNADFIHYNNTIICKCNKKRAVPDTQWVVNNICQINEQMNE